MRAKVIIQTARVIISFVAVLLLPAFLQAQGEKAPKADSIVKISPKLTPETPGPDGKQVLTLKLEIEDGWHIYGNPSGQEDLVRTEVKVSSAKPLQSVKVEYPKGKVINDSVVGKYMIYEGKETIKATLTRAAGDTAALEVALTFQTCNDKQCLFPTTKKLTVP